MVTAILNKTTKTLFQKIRILKIHNWVQFIEEKIRNTIYYESFFLNRDITNNIISNMRNPIYHKIEKKYHLDILTIIFSLKKPIMKINKLYSIIPYKKKIKNIKQWYFI